MRTLLAIAGFELGYYLRRISTWVYFAIFFGVALLIMLAIGGAFPTVSMAVAGSGGNVWVNGPRTLMALVMMVSIFGFIVTAALLGNAIYRDYETRIYPLFFTSPVTKWQYLGGRFIGAYLANAIIFLAIPLGLLIGSAMPILDAERVGPIRLINYFHPYLIGVLPNLLLTGAVFFALAGLTRQMLANYVGGVVLLVGYLIAAGATDPDDEYLAAFLDPFGISAFSHAARYWTPAEQNALLLPLEGVVLWNRLIWIGVGLLVLAFFFWRFRFAHAVGEGRGRGAAREEESEPGIRAEPRGGPLPRPELVYGGAASVRQYFAILGSSFRGIVLNRYFLAILGAGLTFLVLAADQVGKLYGTNTWPVTYGVLELMGGMFAIFVLIVITFYGGELVWRERDHQIDQVVDATPVRTWVPFAAKLTALIAIVALLQGVLLLSGVATQAAKGYFNFELGLYLQYLFGYSLFDYALLCVFVMLVHVIVNHKYMGHAVVVLYYMVVIFAGQIGLEHNLLTYGSDSGLVYSDMNGYGPYATPYLWFKAYWAAWALLFAIAANLLWVRGKETGGRRRLMLAQRRFGRPALTGSLLAAGLIAVLGAFVFYNTNVLNDFERGIERERAAAEYERLYKALDGMPQPRVTSIALEVDLFPEQRDVHVRGSYGIENRGATAIDSVLVRIPSTVEIVRLDFGIPAEALVGDEELGVHLYRLSEPLLPGAARTVEFEIAYLTRGFANEVTNLRLVENGTFLSSGMMPQFGYSEGAELQDDEVRRKHDLPPRPRMPEADDMEARMNNPLSGDADWVDFRATISTAPDQIAVAPGYLEREWEADGRRYFEYRMDAPMLAFYSVLSARYEVARDRWNEVDIEIFHDPAHRYNLARMTEAVKESLDYFTSAFGPYQHRQVRILEFPRYQTFAQSFPNTIPYSEAIGFIARIEDPEEDIDYPFYVTAHEVAHQWWGHQTVGGAVRGSTFIIETLAQYSAMMVMEKEYGPEQVKQFLRYELDSYLMGRAFERRREVPLLEVENQGYIHYNKGALVMYALRDYIGEEAVNGALRNFLEATRFQEPPYTSAPELYAEIQAVTPDSLRYLLVDMFEEITLYANRALAATATDLGDGRYRVAIDVEAAKLRADSIGNEAPVPMNDYIDIGVFGPAPRGQREGPLLYLEKHRITDGAQTIEVEVEGQPARAGIDPLNKLIDRQARDNTVGIRDQGSGVRGGGSDP